MPPLKKITIAFDAKRAAQNRTGLGNYSRFIIRTLAGKAKKLVLYIPNAHHQDAIEDILDLKHVKPAYPNSVFYRLFSSLWRAYFQTFTFKSNNIDIFHGLSNELPLNIKRAKKVRSVVTIHDLIFKRFPECYGFWDRKIYDFKFRRACQNADRIIAVSECTKRDIINFYDIPERKIDVVYQGCDERFRKQYTSEAFDTVKQKYNLPDKFILYVGSIERRKNLMLLAKALKHMESDTPVIALGRKTPYAVEVAKYIEKEGLSARFRMISGVGQDDLPLFYQLSSVFVYPSRFEGFGIPILEALCSGTPVIACTGSCLEEAGGPQSLYVDPDDDQALASAIDSIINNPLKRSTMIIAGHEYAERFKPKNLREDLKEVYKKALRK